MVSRRQKVGGKTRTKRDKAGEIFEHTESEASDEAENSQIRKFTQNKKCRHILTNERKLVKLQTVSDKVKMRGWVNFRK